MSRRTGHGEMDWAVHDDVASFGREVAAHLEALLRSDFVGAYFVGSIALGGYVPGESDVDIVAVSARHVVDDLKRSVAKDLLDLTGACPARGLEFTLYRREVSASPPTGADFELNVNGGPRMSPSINLDAREQPSFWYVIDRTIAHRCGVAISGVPASEVFADAPRPTLLDAMVESMRWHRQHEGATLYSVLNACRA
ncbi:MAG: nucleotidyltransferase domain-containing protein, partial [Chloroflexota bacterium]